MLQIFFLCASALFTLIVHLSVNKADTFNDVGRWDKDKSGGDGRGERETDKDGQVGMKVDDEFSVRRGVRKIRRSTLT